MDLSDDMQACGKEVGRNMDVQYVVQSHIVLELQSGANIFLQMHCGR